MIVDPKSVAREGVTACLRGDAIVTPGLTNRLSMGLVPGGAPPVGDGRVGMGLSARPVMTVSNGCVAQSRADAA
jgi:hypothetical protein